MSAVLAVTPLPSHCFFALIFWCISALYPSCLALSLSCYISLYLFCCFLSVCYLLTLVHTDPHCPSHICWTIRSISFPVITNCPAQSAPWASCAPLHPHSQRVLLPPPSLHRWCLPPPLSLSLSRWILPVLSQSPSMVDISQVSPHTPTPQQRTSVGMAWAWAQAQGAPALTRLAADPPIVSDAPGRTSLRPPWRVQDCTSSRQLQGTVTMVARWVAWVERWGSTEDWVGRECPQRDAGKPHCLYGDTTQQRETESGMDPFPWSGAHTHTATHTDAPTSSAARVYPGTETQCMENSCTHQLIWKRGVKTRRQRARQQTYSRQKMVRISDCLECKL